MDTSNPLNLIIAGIYFLLVGVLTLFSLFGVYVLLRYGQNRLLSFLVCCLYALFYISLLSQSYQTLLTIK